MAFYWLSTTQPSQIGQLINVINGTRIFFVLSAVIVHISGVSCHPVSLFFHSLTHSNPSMRRNYANCIASNRSQYAKPMMIHTQRKLRRPQQKAIVTHKAPRWSPRQGKGNANRTIDCDRRPQQNALSKKLWNNQRRRRHCNNNDVKWHSRRTGREGRRTERFLN